MNNTSNPTSTAAAEKPVRRQSSRDVAAQRRREALQAFLDALEMTAADLARTLGFPTANAIYNHLHGRSASLSLPTIEAILDHFDDTTFEELTGRQPRPLAQAGVAQARAPTRTLDVTTVAAAGVWARPGIAIPKHRESLTLPASAMPLGTGGFAVLVGTPGAEAAYPAGSLLACRRLEPGEPLITGSRVIVHRLRDQDTEVTVREVMPQDGDTWLMSVSTRAEHQEALRLPRNRTPRHEGPGFRVEGVVAWAWIPQPGTTVASI